MEQTPTARNTDAPEGNKSRKRRWGPPLPPEQIDFRKRQHDDSFNPHQRKPSVHEDELSFKRFKGFRRGRSSSTCRQNHPTFERKHKGTWRCLVCYLWNDNERYVCARCGAQEGVDKDDKTSHERDRFSLAFSRYRAGTSVDTRPSISTPSTRDWPPVFESNGSEYVFDSRSEMFYESRSDFFYDPKSKLYYSNKRRAYFRYDESKVPRFQQVTESQAPTRSGSGSASPESATTARTKGSSISINIKSTERSLSRARGRSVDSRVTNAKKKEQLANMDKWEQRAKEEAGSRASGDSEARKSLSASLDRAREAGASAERSMSQQREILEARKVPFKTAAGLPICALCRRKFPSVEMLRRHEQHSELHKTNLMKSGLKSDVPSESVETKPKEPKQKAPAYTDRASRRRLLYGELPTIVPQRPVSFVEKEKVRALPVEPAAVLGQSNIGHQLFKKMVAKTAPEGHEAVPPRGALEETLKQDWERIEAMAKDGGISVNPNEKGGIASGRGSAWRHH